MYLSAIRGDHLSALLLPRCGQREETSSGVLRAADRGSATRHTEARNGP
jgi:hypothetical protein